VAADPILGSKEKSVLLKHDFSVGKGYSSMQRILINKGFIFPIVSELLVGKGKFFYGKNSYK
jgi:hypothetical protein